MIFLPMFVLVLLSFAVGLLLLKERFKAVKSGLNPGYFVYNKGGKLPESLIKVSQHYENLFETPILFYVACVSLYATATVTLLNLGMACLYVFSRFMHAYVHIGQNNLPARRRTFLFSLAILFALWLEFMLELVF